MSWAVTLRFRDLNQPRNPFPCKPKEKRKYSFPHMKQVSERSGYQEDTVLS
jgi:hypothetical protein